MALFLPFCGNNPVQKYCRGHDARQVEHLAQVLRGQVETLLLLMTQQQLVEARQEQAAGDIRRLREALRIEVCPLIADNAPDRQLIQPPLYLGRRSAEKYIRS